MHKRRRKPYRQGALDGLCGPYSLVNAVHALHGLHKDHATALYIDALTYLNHTMPVLERIELGTGTREMSQLVALLAKKQDVRCVKPFHRKSISFHTMWSTLQRFSAEEEGVMLVGIAHLKWEHWTVVTQVTATRLVLFDSGALKCIHRRRCTLKKSTPNRPFQLFPTAVYFLRRFEPTTDQSFSRRGERHGHF